MAKEKHKEEMRYCPWLDCSRVWKRSPGKNTFLEHLNSSRIEFLKAIRSLFDERIDSFEKTAAKRGKRMPKIEVE
jgi:hypothetical protein